MCLKDQIDSARRITDTETTNILSDSSLIGYGGDHHAANEELYYYMKKRDTDTSKYELINKISKIDNNSSYS